MSKPANAQHENVRGRIMSQKPLNTAVLFLVFNRPDTTAQVFEAIRKAQPSRLYVSADGPREGLEGEYEKTNTVRTIATNIDWPCEVKTLFRDINLGCKHAVSDAITWFFEHEEYGIILEDDCLPTASFFKYCDELLLRFKEHYNVMQICGFNPLVCNDWLNSYGFSRFGPIWGWASWRRAWQNYDVRMQSWPTHRSTLLLKGMVRSDAEYKWRIQLFDKVYGGQIDTWDYQWAYAKMISGGASILPWRSLIANIGFSAEATHTKAKPSGSILKNHELCFPLVHNDIIEEDLKYGDDYLKKSVFSNHSKLRKIFNLARRISISD